MRGWRGGALLRNQKFYVWKPPKLLRDPSWCPSLASALIRLDISARLKTQNNPANPREASSCSFSSSVGKSLRKTPGPGSDSLELFSVLKDKKLKRPQVYINYFTTQAGVVLKVAAE